MSSCMRAKCVCRRKPETLRSKASSHWLTKKRLSFPISLKRISNYLRSRTSARSEATSIRYRPQMARLISWTRQIPRSNKNSRFRSVNPRLPNRPPTTTASKYGQVTMLLDNSNLILSKRTLHNSKRLLTNRLSTTYSKVPLVANHWAPLCTHKRAKLRSSCSPTRSRFKLKSSIMKVY